MFGPFGPPGGPEISGESPAMAALRRRLRIPKVDEIYYGSDQRVQVDRRSAIEASQTFEKTSGGNQGMTGGCGQDPAKVSGSSK